MRYHYISLPLLVIAVNISGCSFIGKTVYQAKQPKVETESSITTWLSRNGISNKRVTAVEPASYLSALGFYGFHPMLFNRKGDFVSVGYNNDGRFCPKNVDEFLRTMKPGFERGDEHISNFLVYAIGKEADTAYPKLASFFSLSRSLDGRQSYSFTDYPAYDYTLVIPFSIFMGKTLQVKKMKTFLEAVSQNQHATINIILMNLDKQSWWGAEWINKINIEV